MILLDSPPVTPTPASNTMSLAILPSNPMIYGQNAPATTTLLPPTPPSNKKPKLSLNTGSLPSTFGKGSTSLRLETLSATSPTIRNTFRNAYPITQSDKPPPRQKPKLSPLATNLPPPTTRLPTPLRTDLTTPPSSGLSATSSSFTLSASTSTADCPPVAIPYKLPYNACSILKNGPLPRRTPSTQYKPMFPATKSVSFRAPLTEEIHTSKYTMKHSDIESSTSTISTLELSPPSHGTDARNHSQSQLDSKPSAGSEEERSPKLGDKRESSDEEDSDTCPATPVAGRRKRHRLWQWTLGPIESAKPQEMVAGRGDEDQATSEKVEGEGGQGHCS